MPTGALKTNIYSKKLMPYDQLKTGFLDYLDGRQTDLYNRMITDDGSYLALTAVTPGAGNDQFSIPGAFDGASGDGYTISFAALDPLLQNVQFENAIGIVYHMGLRRVLVEDGVEVNPRTGKVEYVQWREDVGNVGNPNAVTDLGATIRLDVNSVTDAVTHVGRIVRVWLSTPLSDNPTVAFEDCNVQWDGLNNYIVTSGLLGQSPGSVSVAPADYRVHELGPTVVTFPPTDLRTQSGVLFLAAITGTGPGAPILPPNIDTTDQKVILWSITGWTEVTRVDIHGDTKIQVTADALDVDEDQITVLDKTLARTFAVNEDGVVHFPNTTVDLDPKQFPFLSFVGYNPGGDTVGFRAGGGGLKVDVYLEGNLLFAYAASALVDSKTHAARALEFIDVNMPVAEQLSSAADPNYSTGIHYQDGCILGGISEGQEIADHNLGPSVMWGLDPSITAPNNVTIAVGDAYGWTNSGLHDYRYGRIFRFTSPTVLDFTPLAAKTYFVYLDVFGAITMTSANITAMDDGRVPLCLVTWDGVTLSNLIDIRFLSRQIDHATVVTVGPDSGNRRQHNFLTLEGAINWANQVHRYIGFAGPQNHAPIEIVVNGPVTESNTIFVTAEGLTIRGAVKTTQAQVTWAFDGVLFDIDADFVTIKDLNFLHGGVAGGSAHCVQLSYSAAASGRFSFLNNVCSTAGPQGIRDWIYVPAGVLKSVTLTVRDNICYTLAATAAADERAIRVDAAVLVAAWIEDNRFIGYGVVGTYDCIEIHTGTLVHIEGNTLQAGRKGIYTSGAGTGAYWNIENNTFTDFDDEAIRLQGTGYSCFIRGNTMDTIAGSGTVGCYSSWSQSTIGHNTIRNMIAVATTAAIDLGATAIDSVVVGNTMKAVTSGVNSLAGDVRIEGNFVEADQGWGISVVDNAVVVGNEITEWNIASGVPAAIYVNGINCVITGNLINNTAAPGTWGVHLTAASHGSTVTGNTFYIAVSDVANSACGVHVLGDWVTVTGNTFAVVGDAVNGGVGVLIENDHVTVTGNTFGRIWGSCVYVGNTSNDFSITGNTSDSSGLAAVVNPLTGTTDVDAIFVDGDDGTVSANTAGTLAAGGYCVNLTANSSGVVAQLNHKRAGGAGTVIDSGAGNLIGASAVNNNL
jgi:hypothetical protein